MLTGAEAFAYRFAGTLLTRPCCRACLDSLPAFGTPRFIDSIENVMAFAAARLSIRKDLRTVASRQDCVGGKGKHGCGDGDHHYSKYVGEPSSRKGTERPACHQTWRNGCAHGHKAQDSRAGHHRNCRSPEPVFHSRCSNRSGVCVHLETNAFTIIKIAATRVVGTKSVFGFAGWAPPTIVLRPNRRAGRFAPRPSFAVSAEPSYHVMRGLPTIRAGELDHGGRTRAQQQEL